MSKRNTKLVRINKDCANELERALPKLNWPERIEVVKDFSIIKHKDKVGNFLYGKTTWKKMIK